MDWYALEIGRNFSEIIDIGFDELDGLFSPEFETTDNDILLVHSTLDAFSNIILQKMDQFYYDESKMYSEKRILHVADYYGSGIRPLFKDGDTSSDKYNIYENTLDLSKGILEKNKIPENYFVVSFYKYNPAIYDIKIEDMDIFVGDENFGEKFIDGTGLCRWLSSELGMVTVFIYDSYSGYVKSHCWDDGEHEEGYLRYVNYDYESTEISLPNEEQVIEEDEDACFLPSEEIIKILY